MVCKTCCMNFTTLAMGSPTGKSDLNMRLQPAQGVGNGHSGKQIPIPVAAGKDHTCAILDAGGVKCWGVSGAWDDASHI